MKRICSILILLTCSLLTAFAQGRHARVTLTEPGTLEAVLHKGGFTSIDSLTLAGTFGGGDLNYLRERGGVVGGLSYLNLTDAVLTNDEVPYATQHEEPYYNYFYLAPKNSMRYVVTETGGEAHWYRSDLTYAFREMKNLSTILLPKTQTIVGASMCQECENLTKVVIPSSVDSIGPRAFESCRNLTSVSAPHVTKYAYSCFNETGLTSYTFPQGTKSIPAYIFRQCPLRSIEIPGSVEYIGEAAFIACGELRSAVVNEGVTRIDNDAFQGCYNLVSMSLPSTLKDVGLRAFDANPWLESISPQGGILYVGNIAYEARLGGAQTVTIKEGTVGIASCLLSDQEIISVKLPSTLKVIGDAAFIGNAFSKITLPEGLERIGSMAFAACNRITSVTIPESVTEIGPDAFRYCEKLAHVDYNAIDARIKESFVNMYAAMGGWPLYADGYFILTPEEEYYPGVDINSGMLSYTFSTEALKTITIGPKVKHIPASIFGGTPELESVQMGGAVESIGREAFRDCTKLKSIDLSGVKRIDARAFLGTEMEEFVLPATIERIGHMAFCPNIYYNSHPQKVISNIKEPKPVTYFLGWGDTAVGDVIYNYPSSWYTSPATLYVPRGTKAKYEALPSWKNSFAAIEEMEDTQVDDISTEMKANNCWHTLLGTEVSSPARPGIYINGGRKMIVK